MFSDLKNLTKKLRKIDVQLKKHSTVKKGIRPGIEKQRLKADIRELKNICNILIFGLRKFEFVTISAIIIFVGIESELCSFNKDKDPKHIENALSYCSRSLDKFTREDFIQSIYDRLEMYESRQKLTSKELKLIEQMKIAISTHNG